MARATRHASDQQTQRRIEQPKEERAADGRVIMRMNTRGGPQVGRKTETAQEVVDRMWGNATDKMRDDWLRLYAAILSSAGADHTPSECSALADAAYFEFYARSNPSKYGPA